MSPGVINREEVSVAESSGVPAGFSGHVVPNRMFGDVALDSQFTGSASRGPDSPYFSQLDNLDDMALIYTPYAPVPVRERVVFVTVSRHPAEVGALLGGAAVAEPQWARVEFPEARPQERVGTDIQTGLSLAEVTAQLRAAVDLPVQDIARMAGIGRRQYYNLLQGKAQTMKRTADEQRLRLVHQQLLALADTVMRDPSAVRAAVLMPLADSDRRSYFDIAESGDTTAMHHAFSELWEMVRSGAKLEHRLPPSGTFAAGDPRWAEADEFVRRDSSAGE